MCSRVSRLLLSATKNFHVSSSSYARKILESSTIGHRRKFSTDDFPKKTNDGVKDEEELENDEPNLFGSIGEQFQKFRDEDANVIFDVDEEKKKMIDLDGINALHEYRDPYEGLNMKRGVKGVYDIEDLVQLLRRDKAKEIFVASVPEELSYVDYIVIVTGKSVRHMSALATFVRKVYKVKAGPKDILPKIEGATSNNWMAIDLGNIALHIFSNSARRTYDLETLWTVGGKYDGEMNKSTAEEQFEAKYNKFLEGYQPADA